MPSETSPRVPMTPPDTARLVRALCNPRCYPHDAQPIQLIETHISYVLLTGDYAYKLKKPVKLPFLDFSTLERRKHFCDVELELNRRLAPDLYLDVVPIRGSIEAPRVGGDGRSIEPDDPTADVIEYAVKLRQFDPDSGADRLLTHGTLERGLFERFAERIARFHINAPRAEGEHPGRLAARNVAELDDALAAAQFDFSAADLAVHTRREAERLDELFAERVKSGAVRDGHGDLHLGNIVLIDGELHAFDALEFDPKMRALDVIDEIAFVAMDLTAHARPDLAHAFLNRYLEVTGDYGGTELLSFYVLYRALVRAKVGAIKASALPEPGAAAEEIALYLALGRRLIAPRVPHLILTYGLSGSGKTTVTTELVAQLPAIRLRSDLERKRLAGVEETARDRFGIGQGRYDAATTDKTYDRLLRGAASALSGGSNVIVDATFLSRARRHAFIQLAERHGASLTVLMCEAPEATLRARIRARDSAGKDASEATEAVLDAQLKQAEPPQPSEGAHIVQVDTSSKIDYDALVKRLLSAARTQASDDREA